MHVYTCIRESVDAKTVYVGMAQMRANDEMVVKCCQTFKRFLNGLLCFWDDPRIVRKREIHVIIILNNHAVRAEIPLS